MKRRAVRSMVGLVVVAGGSLLAACGDDGDDGGDGGLGGGTLPDEVVEVDDDPAEVDALDNTFDAEGIQVPAGTTVRWVNEGQQAHDVAPAEGEGWGVEADGFLPGDSYEHTFEEPGTYGYYCTIHGTATAGMTGVIVVE
jgi:plastocyanin